MLFNELMLVMNFINLFIFFKSIIINSKKTIKN
jgi:hypothetical protein